MYMTIDEIYEKYSENWVFLINCKENEQGDFGGEVVLRTKTLKELYEKMEKYKNEESETIYFGIPPKGAVYLL